MRNTFCLVAVGIVGTAMFAGAAGSSMGAAAVEVRTGQSPTLGCLSDTAKGYANVVKPAQCILQSAADFNRYNFSPIESSIARLRKMHWSSWSATSARGTGILEAGMGYEPRVRLDLSKPKPGCPPDAKGSVKRGTFARARLTILRHQSLPPRSNAFALPVAPFCGPQH
jgi:hypothetical protein